MADLQCRLQEAVDANREVLNTREEERRTKAEITASRQQQAETAKAQRGTAAKPSAAEQPAKASKGIPSASGSERSKTTQQQQLEDASRRKGIARLWSDKRELSFRRADGFQLEPIYICTDLPDTNNFSRDTIDQLNSYTVAIYSGETGLLTEFQPYKLSGLAAINRRQPIGLAGAIESYASSLSSSAIDGVSETFVELGGMLLDHAFAVDNKLCLVFLRQRWVRFRANYLIATYSLVNDSVIGVIDDPIFGVIELKSDMLVVNVDLESGSYSHSSFPFHTYLLEEVYEALRVYGAGGFGWSFRYRSSQDVVNPLTFLAQATGLDSVFGDCAEGLFRADRTDSYSFPLVITSPDSLFWSSSLGSGNLLTADGYTPLDLTAFRSRASRVNRADAFTDHPRWQALSVSESIRVIGAPLRQNGPEEVLEISEFELDLDNCSAVSYLDQYWSESFDGLGDDLATTADVFLQEAVPLADDPLEPTGVWLNAIANDAPADPYAAVYAVNAPLRQKDLLSFALPVRQIVYRASNG